MIELPDVDLDVKDRERAASLFGEAVVSTQLTDKNTLVKHKTGVHFQKIPQDPTTGMAVFPYDIAEEMGYHKVDIIPNHVYDMVGSEEELQCLLDEPVNWDWFTDERFYDNTDTRYRMTHLSGSDHIYRRYPPKSMEDVAILLAVIRPRKRYLIGEPWEKIKKLIWKKIPEENPDNDPRKYFFKKSHSFAFAMLVVLHAKIIARRLSPKVYEGEDSFFF